MSPVRDFLAQIAGNELAYHGVVALCIVILFLLSSYAVRALLRWSAHRIFSRTETVLDDRIVAVLLAHVRPLMVLAGLHVAMRELRKAVLPSDETLLQLLGYADSLLFIALVLLILKIVAGILRELVGWSLQRITADRSSNLKETLGPLTTRVANLLVGMVAIIIVLDHFGVNIGSLLVSLGVGSLAVALAAQETLANMIAGFVILVDRPFRVGDRVELQSGQIGDVHEIGLRSTRLVNADNNLIIVPNAELVRSRVVNFALPVEPMRVTVTLPVAYGTEPALVRRLLLDLAAARGEILPDPPPEVHCTALHDSSVEFTLICRTADCRKGWGAATAIREEAYRRFVSGPLAPPFPRRVVSMQDAD